MAPVIYGYFRGISSSTVPLCRRFLLTEEVGLEVGKLASGDWQLKVESARWVSGKRECETAARLGDFGKCFVHILVQFIFHSLSPSRDPSSPPHFDSSARSASTLLLSFCRSLACVPRPRPKKEEYYILCTAVAPWSCSTHSSQDLFFFLLIFRQPENNFRLSRHANNDRMQARE